jgi:hypothetical protein
VIDLKEELEWKHYRGFEKQYMPIFLKGIPKIKKKQPRI